MWKFLKRLFGAKEAAPPPPIKPSPSYLAGKNEFLESMINDHLKAYEQRINDILQVYNLPKITLTCVCSVEGAMLLFDIYWIGDIHPVIEKKEQLSRKQYERLGKAGFKVTRLVMVASADNSNINLMRLPSDYNPKTTVIGLLTGPDSCYVKIDDDVNEGLQKALVRLLDRVLNELLIYVKVYYSND